MKRQHTEEQKAAAAERKTRFRALWRQVAAMPELERVKLSNKLGLVTCEGRQLSLCNQMLIALQIPSATVLGGFRQWIKQGRAVRKGQHGAMIWVPVGVTKQGESAEPSANVDGDNERRFILGTMFDISQTDEIGTESETATAAA